MFEVEAKVAISKGEFELLKKRLQKEARSIGSQTSSDTYYTQPKKSYIRIRKRGGEYTFDLKKRRTIKGIESNIEMQWRIGDISKWRALLRRLKLMPGVGKHKKSIVFRQNDFIIELNHVRLLGYYLEIERLVKSEKEVGKAKRELTEVFRKLGFPKKRFEAKPYLELLANV